MQRTSVIGVGLIEKSDTIFDPILWSHDLFFGTNGYINDWTMLVVQGTRDSTHGAGRLDVGNVLSDYSYDGK